MTDTRAPLRLRLAAILKSRLEAPLLAPVRAFRVVTITVSAVLLPLVAILGLRRRVP